MIPPKPQTCGLTEKYIGAWLAKNQVQREQLAGNGVAWIRSDADTNAKGIKAALEGWVY